MEVSVGILFFLFLILLFTFISGVLGFNFGLVVRIIDKGLEYGKKLRVW